MDVNEILDIIRDPARTYHQRVLALAKAAENVPPAIPLSRDAQWFVDRGIVYDMGEGNAPYRPRYVTPDYDRFLRHRRAVPLREHGQGQPPGGSGYHQRCVCPKPALFLLLPQRFRCHPRHRISGQTLGHRALRRRVRTG